MPTGLVVAAHGRRGQLETLSGEHRAYVVRRRAGPVVCGDNVEWSDPPTSEVVRIEKVMPRQSELARVAPRGQREVLAANVTQMLVVAATEPAPDLFLMDRFVCAAETAHVSATIVVNKIDLAESEGDWHAQYAQLGYPVVPVSALTHAGLDVFDEILAGEVSILVGQSGVGKSSIVNALLPEAASATSQLSEGSREGRHTTTAVIMHATRNGRLIDTPGVREWLPALPDKVSVQHGFIEIAEVSPRCRFTDCLHTREPECAVKVAVENGAIDERRYASYRRIVNSIDQQPGY